MRQLRSILIDSLYESVDSKALWFLLVICGLLITFCASISFETPSQAAVLEQQSKTLGAFSREGGWWNLLAAPIEVTVTDPKPVDASENWRSDLAGGSAVTFTFKSRNDVDKLVMRWRAFQEKAKERKGRDPSREVRSDPQNQSPVTPEERLKTLEERFQKMNYGYVQARLLKDDPPTYRLAARSEFPYELAGASKMRMLFGAMEFTLWQISMAELIVMIQLFMANVFAGIIGILVAIMVCSGFVPSMLQKGTLDLVLARPVGRGRLLLYKYIGGLWFVFLMSSLLIGGCWTALTLRTGYVNPWFLATVFTITAIFGVIYSVSVLTAIITRSGLLSALLAIFAWGAAGTLGAIQQGIKFLYMGQKTPEWISATLETMNTMVPKTGDLMTLNVYFLSRSHLSDTAYQRTFAKRLPPVDWAWSLGTTAAFAAIMLIAAAWWFKKKDY